eukprot:TRINITY_DN16291_c0_g1_i1.p1 TRINITY_DN16291_c0_g1~~TRINITY_DN16291_c0_g1_i1.p1  ORF type:complete len:976 (+),score=225.51 TRINITY_DN16291_c0_g1_i1:124-3051(+)
MGATCTTECSSKLCGKQAKSAAEQRAEAIAALPPPVDHDTLMYQIAERRKQNEQRVEHMAQKIMLQGEIQHDQAVVAEGGEPGGETRAERKRREKNEKADVSDDEQPPLTVEVMVEQEIKGGNVDSALLLAAHSGNPRCVKRCFMEGADPMAVDQKGLSAAYFAMLSGSMETFLAVLEEETHGAYNSKYFDTRVIAVDGITPLMLAMLHGLTDMYEHLLRERGCKLRLMGKWSVEPERNKEGIAPLDKWLEFLPELSAGSALPTFRPATLRGVGPISFRSDEAVSIDEAIQNRMRVRQFIRQIFAEQAQAWSETLIKLGYKSFVHSMNTNKPVKKVAIRTGEGKADEEKADGNEADDEKDPTSDAADGEAESAEEELEVFEQPKRARRGALQVQPKMRASVLYASSHDTVTATVVPPPSLNSTPQNSEHEDDHLLREDYHEQKAMKEKEKEQKKEKKVENVEDLRGQWYCGSCNNQHFLPLGFVGSHFLNCEKCSEKNWVVLDEKGKGDGSGDEAEVWVNDGKEFANEKDVEKRLKPLLKSDFSVIENTKLRNLLRVARRMTLKKDAKLYEEAERVHSLYLLVGGEVRLKSSRGDDRNVKAGGGERALVLAAETLIGGFSKNGHTRFQETCTCDSDECNIFAFDEEPVRKFCGYEKLETLMYEATSRCIVGQIRIFKYTLTTQLTRVVALCLKFDVCVARTVVVNPEARAAGVSIIAHGTIRVRHGTDARSKLVHVGPIDSEMANIGAGKHVNIFITGPRAIMLALNNQHKVEAVTQNVHHWLLGTEEVASMLKGNVYFNSLAQLLEISAYADCITKSPLFAGVRPDDYRLYEMLTSVRTVDFQKGEFIWRQHDVADGVLVIADGTIALILDDKEISRLTANLDLMKMICLGDLAMVTSARKRACGALCKSSNISAIWIREEMINETFGSVNELLALAGGDSNDVLGKMEQKLGTSRAMFNDQEIDLHAPSRCDG